MKQFNRVSFCRTGQWKTFGILLLALFLLQGPVAGQVEPGRKIIVPAKSKNVKQTVPVKVAPRTVNPDAAVTVTLSAPAPNQQDVPLDAVLSWTATPATGLTFDVYFANSRDIDAEGNPIFVLVSSNQAEVTYKPSIVAGEAYRWKVVAKKSDGTEAASAPSVFFTPNSAPSAAGLTTPANGALRVPATTTFSWRPSVDPEMKMVTYSISLTTESGQYAAPLVTSLSGNSHTLTTPLRHGETYYWKVRSADNMNLASESEEFRFTVDPVSWADPVTAGSFTDPRDNKTYRTVTIGEQEWMAENLALLPAVNNTQYLDNSVFKVYGYTGTDVTEAKNTENYRIYGVLYNQIASRQVCPAGWHLPANAEWNQLVSYLGMTDNEVATDNYPNSGIIADKMREQGSAHWSFTPPTVNNASQFNAMPAGSAMITGFTGLGNGTAWWTSTPAGSEEVITWYLSCPQNTDCVIRRQRMSVDFHTYYSVRCVKD
jgi:uncharacterized protein (TIGR02145 family)